MQILFFADNFPPEKNAQASRVYERARYWIRWGHSVTVITCAPNFPEGEVYPGYKNDWCRTQIMDGIRVVRVKTYITANRGTVRRMADYLSFLPAAFLAGIRENADVVAATSPQMFAGLAGCMTASFLRRPFLLEVSDLWPESILAVGAMRKSNVITRTLEKMAQFLYQRADRIVVLTESFQKKIEAAGVPRRNIDVVLNGVDLDLYSPRNRDKDLARQYGISEDHFVVGYIGTLGMAHGLEKVLEAAAKLSGTPALFLLVGPGAERERLRELAAEQGLQNVLFIPPQPKEQMPRYWSLCDVALVHLKDTELFETVIPSKIFEAMGMGLPIALAAPRGEASRLVLGEGVGWHVPAGDANALAMLLTLLTMRKEDLTATAERSRKAAFGHSRERQAELYMEALAKVQPRNSKGEKMPAQLAVR
jgi:glycosyltransferase involved in cell wall biosynthesis